MKIVQRLLLIGSVVACHAGTSVAQTAVNFADQNLESAVRDELAKPVGPLTPEDLADLQTLSAGRRNIVALSGLEWATNLMSLDLSGNTVGDLTPLAGLTKLNYLELRSNPLTNFSTVLSGLTNLETLYLGTTSISNVGFLQNLKHLRFLNLDHNEINDLAPLAVLPDLRDLDLSYNPITNLDELSSFTNLQSLYLSGNSISNVTGLSALSGLTVLSVSGGRLSDLNALAGLTNLFAVFADYNRLTNIEGIHQLPGPFHVRLIGNRLDLSPGSSSLTVIQDLQFQEVNVIYQPQNEPPSIFGPPDWFISTNIASSLRFYLLDDVTPASRMILSAISSNTDLIPQENIEIEITDEVYTLNVTPVADQTGVSWITIVVTDEAGVSVNMTVRVGVVVPEPVSIPDPNLEAAVRLALEKPGGNLTSLDLLGLTYLEISDTLVTNLAGLERATNLSYFRFENHPVPDLSPLTSLSNLAGLYLQGAAFNNLAPLQQLPQLNSLELDNNRIFDLSPLMGLTNLAFVSLIQNVLTNINPLQNLPRLTQVNVNLNLLDLNPGSPALMVVEGLEESGVIVSCLPQRSPPVLSIRPSWVIKSNATSTLSFGAKDKDVIYDTELPVTVKSSNTNLLPNESVMIGKSANTDWFMYATPKSNQVGSTTITLFATNDVGMGSSTTMLVSVVAPLPLDNQLLGGGNLAWSTGGNATWFGQTKVTHDGVSAAQSGSIQNGQQTWMQTSFEGPGILTFWWKVSSELNFDWLELRVNGQLQPGRISGEVDWQQQTLALSRGNHEVRWRYFKEAADSGGLDNAWVDEVSFLPISWLEVIGSPTNGQCHLLLHLGVGRPYQLQASTNLIHWAPLGIVMATNSVMPFLDVAADFPRRFYRLQDLSIGAIWLQNPRIIGNEFQLELHSPVGLRLEVQFSTNLVNWTGVGVVTNTLGTVQIADPVGGDTAWRFYRALLLLP